MEKSQLIEELRLILGAEKVLTDEEAVLEAGKDYIGFRIYERTDGKNFAPRAACVVKPANTEEVSKVMKFLNENKIDAVPRTGGSSVTQSIEPVPGGVIIDGSAMNEILKIDEINMTVTVRCGTPLEYLENVLNEKGYSAGHFPQSLPMAHIGGLVATRSIGQFSTLYGGIEDLVVGLEAVLADGEIIRVKNVPRRSCGPDLRHLFIGSEGMLGFITEVTVKIFKYRPEERWLQAYAVKDMQTGLDMIRAIMSDGYKPAVVRLHDTAEVQLLLKLEDAVPPEHALLMFIADGPASVAKATGAAIEEYAAQFGVTGLGEKPVLSWLKTRNDECYHMERRGYHAMGLVVDTCEISAEWSEIGGVYSAVIKRLSEEIEYLAYAGGHASHSYMQGTNIYFTFAFLARNVELVKDDYMRVVGVILEETLKRGGSIAHHHGSGKYRTSWMPREHGTSYPLLYKLKDALDPNHILNKGVLLSEVSLRETSAETCPKAGRFQNAPPDFFRVQVDKE
ncbi:MAG: FAD-binding oxidoreductase [Clostridiales bacterium]|jgi:FAD/FMN-containing dehydrogenase|nr:FAD-binding oxidoreductase [Clostridiales bacterium]